MKPSGIEWIGDIPDDWEVIKTKFLFNVYGGSTPKVNVSEYWGDKITWITPGELGDDIKIVLNSKRMLSEKGLNSCGATLVSKGSIIISNRAPIGQVCLAGSELCTNQGCKSLVAKIKLSCLFFYYFFKVQSEVLNMLGNGTTFMELSTSDLLNFKIPFPTIKEQQKIADYLDEKCGEIDATITKQKESIEKLKAYKQSLISETVTKGLDKSAPLKPSGIDYLGDIPSHWEIKKLKFLVSLIDNKTKDGHSISLENIESGTGKLIETENTYDGEGISFKENDLLFGKLRPYLAKVYLSALKGRALGDFYVMRANKGTNPNFLKFVLLSDWFIKIVDSSTYGTKMPRASWDFTGGMRIPLPPISEQDCISSYLETKCSEVDTFIIEKQNIIQKLDAYKKSLIFECVTGKRLV